MEAAALRDLLTGFLGELPREMRVVFIARYWNLYSVAEVAQRYGMSESKVKSILFRAQNKLRQRLAAEGVRV